jgi:hypothetical protein
MDSCLRRNDNKVTVILGLDPGIDSQCHPQLDWESTQTLDSCLRRNDNKATVVLALQNVILANAGIQEKTRFRIKYGMTDKVKNTIIP